MTKRAFYLVLAVGLLANLAFVTSSQAGSTTLTVNSELSSIPTNVTSISAVDVTFSGLSSPLTSVNVVVPAGASYTISNGGNTVDISISSNASAAYLLMGQAFATFTFANSGDPASVSATSTEWVTNAGNVSGQSSVLMGVNPPSVPEPASMSLLGIGMAGLFAFRRFFKRNTSNQS